MSEELLTILQLATNGDEDAIHLILKMFADKTLNEEQSSQVYFFVRTQKSHTAIYFLGLLYKHGYAVRQDYDMSFLTMREAAAKGNAKATYEIGHHFLQGLGVEQNYANALQWLKLAASSPYYIPEAMFDIGLMYEQGLGLDANEQIAQDWFHRAADRGHEEAKGKIR